MCVGLSNILSALPTMNQFFFPCPLQQYFSFFFLECYLTIIWMFTMDVVHPSHDFSIEEVDTRNICVLHSVYCYVMFFICCLIIRRKLMRFIIEWKWVRNLNKKRTARDEKKNRFNCWKETTKLSLKQLLED